MPNTEIFIVSCAKHFPWLEYCLKSIERFCTGFSGTTVLVPDVDAPLLKSLYPNITVKSGQEWPEKGMIWHMAQIMRSDEWCPNADFIVHTDSDCVFTEPVSPDDYITGGKPILYYEAFATITKKHPEVGVWQGVTQACLPFKVLWEVMRKHPGVFHRGLYPASRAQMEIKTKLPMDEYIQSCREQFPNGFCEFNTLGNVAMQYFRNKYILFDSGSNPWPHQKLTQFWGHAPPDVPQQPIFKGSPFKCTPSQLLEMV